MGQRLLEQLTHGRVGHRPIDVFHGALRTGRISPLSLDHTTKTVARSSCPAAIRVGGRRAVIVIDMANNTTVGVCRRRRSPKSIIGEGCLVTVRRRYLRRFSTSVLNLHPKVLIAVRDDHAKPSIIAACRGNKGDLPLSAVLNHARGAGDVVLNPMVYPTHIALGYVAAQCVSCIERR